MFMRIALLLVLGVAVIAARAHAEEISARFGDRPASHTAVIRWRTALSEHKGYREAEAQRFVVEQAELVRIEALKQELTVWQSFRSTLRQGAEDEHAAEALSEVIAAQQLHIDSAEAAAKLKFLHEARVNLQRAIAEINTEIERFARKHDISVIVSTECELPDFRFANLPVRRCRCPRSRRLPEPDWQTPAAARARFDELVVFEHGLDISYDIIGQLNAP
jgi:hypothetical protein